MDNTLLKTIELFEFILESEDQEKEIDDFREELEMYINLLTPGEVADLADYILPKILEENSPLLHSLLKSIEIDEQY